CRHGGYEAALADASVDAVVVATPPDTHRALTLRALEAGKDVIVEKPAFPALADFERARAAARAAGRRVFAAENYYYRPVRVALARLIAEGAVDEPLLLRVNAVKRQRPEGWRADRRHTGGGGLLEGGVHWVNFMASLGPRVERVCAARAGGRAHVAESLAAVFAYEGGMVGTLAFSWEVPSPLQGVRWSALYGRGGSVWFESNGIFLCVRGRKTRISLPGLRDLSGFRAMWADFLRALREGGEPAMTFDDAERDVRLVHEIYRSMDETTPGGPGAEAAG
ncbi:MAG: gfo/Idh/MocA family oxidoreductase, partial [Gemmatimonadetes bacterium]